MKLPLIIPSLCHLCGLTIDSTMSHQLWCQHCQDQMTFQVKRCRCCGLQTETQTVTCGQCLKSPPPWQQMYCLADYRYPLSTLIQQIKRQKRYWLLPPLARMLCGLIPHPAPMIVTVPMNWHQYLLRGFNLSEVIAHEIAKSTPQTQLMSNIFHKHSRAPRQKTLDKAARLRNVRHAFSLNQRPKAHHIAIIDDVVTTGATVRHLSELLRGVGVEKIDIYCLCRTPNDSIKSPKLQVAHNTGK